MKRLFSVLFAILSVCALSAQRVCNVFGFPATEPGYSLGVSACYAGQIGDWLVVAGGCNFPTPGNKTYYSGIYAARIDRDVLSWRLVGMLPEPAAYGVAVASGDSLLFVGGNNRDHGIRAVYSVRFDGAGEKATVSRLADLPAAVDNMAAAKCGGKVYVVGGNHDAKPSAGVLCADLSEGCREWKRLADLPGKPRVQPVCAACGDGVYVWGGFFADGENSIVHTDGCRLDTRNGCWTALAAPKSDGGDELTLSGGIAWTDGCRILATGGVNKEIFLDAISGRYECVAKDDYLAQPIGWYRFSGNLCVFDTDTGEWRETVFADRALARAGAQAIPTAVGTFYIGGELKPALRTPQIVLLEVERPAGGFACCGGTAGR